MDETRADIYYLENSGFAVETKGHLLVFDYIKDGGEVVLGERVGHSNTLVFVSHGHADHFSPTIFRWRQANPSIRYVLSTDVQATGADISAMSPLQRIVVGNVEVSTYDSTDLGVSFLVAVDGLNIFHAGDLNWWHWKEESTDDEVRQSEELFMQALAPIIGQDIDIAFFPVDPRLGSDYALGAERFIEVLKPKMLVPMHFRENYAAVRTFADKIPPQSTIVSAISHRGQHIVYTKKGD